MYFEKDTATEIRNGSLVTITDSGTLVYANNDTTDRPVGVARRNDTTTDSADVPVDVPIESAVEWLIDTDSDGGAADTDIGRYCAVDTVGGAGVSAGDSAATRVDINDTGVRQVFITDVVSATQVIGVLVRSGFQWPGPADADTATGVLTDSIV